MKIIRKVIITMIALGLVAVGCGTAGAAPITITLSHFSSDLTPAGVLDARFVFSTIGNYLNLLVYNDTADPDAYKINQIYFNATGNVTGLELVPDFFPPGWTLLNDEAAGGFGVFDFYLDGGNGNDSNLIPPGEFESFGFAISGTGPPFPETDFVSFSTIPPGDTVALAAAKFIGGPADNDPDEEDEDSAFGAAVPIPGAVWLLGSGLVGLVAIRRKRSVK